MRFASYTIAVLVAAGLIYFVSQSPEADNAAAGPEPTAAATSDVATTETASSEAGETLVTLRVPDMHCPFACYPAVKKTLEQEPGVLAVDLGQQKQEGAIDNPEVKIQVSADFNSQAAIDALAKAGFDKSTKVQ